MASLIRIRILISVIFAIVLLDVQAAVSFKFGDGLTSNKTIHMQKFKVEYVKLIKAIENETSRKKPSFYTFTVNCLRTRTSYSSLILKEDYLNNLNNSNWSTTSRIEASANLSFFKRNETLTITFFLVLFVTISICSVFTNCLIIFLILKHTKLRNVSNIFVFNLAIADLIIGLFVAPFQFQATFLQKWMFPEIICKLVPFARTLSVNVSITVLVSISIDQYFIILHPFKPKLTKKKCLIIVFLIWSISILFSLFKLYNFHIEYNIDRNSFICLPQNFDLYEYETYFLFLIQYVLPIIILSFVYLRIGQHIYQRRDIFNDQILAKQLFNKKKVLKMMFILIVLFIICWSPIHFFKLMNVLYPDAEFFKSEYAIFVWLSLSFLAMSSSCLKLYIYRSCSMRFRKRFKKLFGFFTCVENYESNGELESIEDSNVRLSLKIINSNVNHSLVFRKNPDKVLYKLDTFEEDMLM